MRVQRIATSGFWRRPLLLLAVAVAAATLAAAQTDVEDCAFTASDGTYYDLSPLRDHAKEFGRDFIYPSTSQTIYFNICELTIAAGECQSKQRPAVVYRQHPAPPCIILGTLPSLKFESMDPSNPHKGVRMTYSDGDRCEGALDRGTISFSVNFICDPNAGTGKAASYNQQSGCVGVLDFPTKYGCPVHHGLSGGWIFIILLLVGSTLYCGIGFWYKRSRQGAQGREAIPNVEFWQDLPSLVKDGARFSYSKCMSLVGKGDNSYQYQPSNANDSVSASYGAI